MPLSDRVRPNVEAAPWVIEEIKGLESGLALACERVVKAETALAALEAKLEARRVLLDKIRSHLIEKNALADFGTELFQIINNRS